MSQCFNTSKNVFKHNIEEQNIRPTKDKKGNPLDPEADHVVPEHIRDAKRENAHGRNRIHHPENDPIRPLVVHQHKVQENNADNEQDRPTIMKRCGCIRHHHEPPNEVHEHT